MMAVVTAETCQFFKLKSVAIFVKLIIHMLLLRSFVHIEVIFAPKGEKI